MGKQDETDTKLIGDSHVVINGESTWPAASERNATIVRTLTYGPDVLDRKDRMMAASIICAYFELIHATQKRRNAVCKKLKVAETVRVVKLQQEQTNEPR